MGADEAMTSECPAEAEMGNATRRTDSTQDGETAVSPTTQACQARNAHKHATTAWNEVRATAQTNWQCGTRDEDIELDSGARAA
jgi:hypothetical protein